MGMLAPVPCYARYPRRQRRRYRCNRHAIRASRRSRCSDRGARQAGEKGMSVTIADIEAARRTIAGTVLRTPMLPAPKLSALTGADVFVKYENLQVTNSFKDRGALNKL